MRTIAWAFPIASVLIPVCIFAADFSGSVLDGDTIEVLHHQHPERIRLKGSIALRKVKQSPSERSNLHQSYVLGGRSRSKSSARTNTGAPLEK